MGKYKSEKAGAEKEKTEIRHYDTEKLKRKEEEAIETDTCDLSEKKGKKKRERREEFNLIMVNTRETGRSNVEKTERRKRETDGERKRRKMKMEGEKER